MKRIDVDLASGLQAFEAKHFTRAMQLLSPLAEEGNLEAQHRCAIMYQNGLGNKENPLLAFKWMKKAAESGHPEREETRVTDAYEAGYKDGQEKNLANISDWKK